MGAAYKGIEVAQESVWAWPTASTFFWLRPSEGLGGLWIVRLARGGMESQGLDRDINWVDFNEIPPIQ
jgi:hypothetical protein